MFGDYFYFQDEPLLTGGVISKLIICRWIEIGRFRFCKGPYRPGPHFNISSNWKPGMNDVLQKQLSEIL
jgi:hypothetical protein